MAHAFTAENFETEVLKSDKPVLVDFWAPWCGPCQMLGPVIDELAEEVGDEAKVGKVNVDEAAAIASQFGIMSIPTIMVFKGGAAVEQVTGVQSKEKLIEMLKKAQ
jgi:thioredoxin 1